LGGGERDTKKLPDQRPSKRGGEQKPNSKIGEPAYNERKPAACITGKKICDSLNERGPAVVSPEKRGIYKKPKTPNPCPGQW